VPPADESVGLLKGTRVILSRFRVSLQSPIGETTPVIVIDDINDSATPENRTPPNHHLHAGLYGRG